MEEPDDTIDISVLPEVDLALEPRWASGQHEMGSFEIVGPERALGVLQRLLDNCASKGADADSNGQSASPVLPEALGALRRQRRLQDITAAGLREIEGQTAKRDEATCFV